MRRKVWGRFAREREGRVRGMRENGRLGGSGGEGGSLGGYLGGFGRDGGGCGGWIWGAG